MHKGVSSSAPGNYHPISVVPVVVKILEKVVAQQLSSYFEGSQCLTTEQLVAFGCSGLYHPGS